MYLQRSMINRTLIKAIIFSLLYTESYPFFPWLQSFGFSSPVLIEKAENSNHLYAVQACAYQWSGIYERLSNRPQRAKCGEVYLFEVRALSKRTGALPINQIGTIFCDTKDQKCTQRLRIVHNTIYFEQNFNLFVTFLLGVLSNSANFALL